MDLQTELLERLAIPAIYERGERYFRSGRVSQLSKEGLQFKARVNGSRPYFPFIDLSGEEWLGTCTCPYEGEGICKHLVATGLAIVAGQFMGSGKTAWEQQALRISLDAVSAAFQREIIERMEGDSLSDSSQSWATQLDALLTEGRLADSLRLLLGMYEGALSLQLADVRQQAFDVYGRLEKSFIQQIHQQNLAIADRKAGIEWLFRRWDKYEALYDGVSRTVIRYDLYRFEDLLIGLASEKVTAHFTLMKLQGYGITARQMARLHAHLLSIQNRKTN